MLPEIQIFKTETPKAKPADESTLGFGKTFSDHMFMIEYDEGQGWHDARIVPYGPIPLYPAAPVLHYAQEIFEGLKAYRRADGNGIQLFRPEENAKRMNNSAERMCMPTLDVAYQVAAMKALVELEKEWVPHRPGTSLYLRPTMIATGNELGVHPSKHYLYYIICAPSGAYYKNGMAPVRIRIEDRYVRAVRGGIGACKTGGNYAASLKAGAEAANDGFDQVLWLDGRENRYVQEVGAMNMMFVMDGKLLTAPIEDCILPGITRKSIMQLAADKGMTVEERPIDIAEIFDAYDRGALTEAFGTGTAAVISPVGEMVYKDRSMKLSGGKIGPVAQAMYDTLVGIQTGALEDPYSWVTPV